MIHVGESACSKCGGGLKYYDTVFRIVRTKNRLTKRITVKRFKCLKCRRLHRELPDEVFPYKQYELEVILGVIEGLITSETLGFEDYPCELTMALWKNDSPTFISKYRDL